MPLSLRDAGFAAPLWQCWDRLLLVRVWLCEDIWLICNCVCVGVGEGGYTGVVVVFVATPNSSRAELQSSRVAAVPQCAIPVRVAASESGSGSCSKSDVYWLLIYSRTHDDGVRRVIARMQGCVPVRALSEPEREAFVCPLLPPSVSAIRYLRVSFHNKCARLNNNSRAPLETTDTDDWESSTCVWEDVY